MISKVRFFIKFYIFMDIFHPLYKLHYKLWALKTHFLWRFFPHKVKKGRRELLIRKTNSFIAINAYLLAHVNLLKLNSLYISLLIGSQELGQLIRVKLNESTEISPFEMGKLLDEFIHNKSGYENQDLNYINKKDTRKNLKELYRNSSYVRLVENKNTLKIYPLHQIGLNEFQYINLDDEKLYFEYSIDIGEDELGQAVFRAFEKCTSIYSHYLK